jgi:hypothetical protein
MEKSTTEKEVTPVDLDNIDFEVHSSKPDLSTIEKTDTDTSKDDEEEEKDENIDENESDSDLENEEEKEEQSEEDEPADDSSDDDTAKEEDVHELSDEEAHEIASQVFGQSVEEIQEKLDRLEELESKAQEPKFKSDRHEKLFNFVNKYSGDDFESGIVRFARIASLDVEKLAPKEAMKEAFILDNHKLSRDKAEKLFEHDFNKEFGELDEEIAETKMQLKGDEAKEKLNSLKQETLTEKKPESDAPKYDETARNNYLQGVEKSLDDFDNIDLAIDSDPNSEFNFEIENKDQIRELMTDFSLPTLADKLKWVDVDAKTGKVKAFNHDKMKLDLAFLLNKEKLLTDYYNHGKNAGKEVLEGEIANRTVKSKPTQTSFGKNSKTSDDALDNAILSMPTKKK